MLGGFIWRSFDPPLYREDDHGISVFIANIEAHPESNPTISTVRKYAGIGRMMIAYGIQLSIDSGHGGIVTFEAKTDELYVNLIFSQTRAYLAANTCDFCFLLKYLFDLPMRVDIVTDDDDQRIDTILDVENQRQNLKELAEKYTSIRRKDYLEWRIRLEHEMTKAEEK